MSTTTAAPRKAKATNVVQLRSAADLQAALARIDERTEIMGGRMDKIDERLSKIVDVMESITRIEERQVGIKDTLNDHLKEEAATAVLSDSRLKYIENKLPALIETRKWIIMGVIGIVSMVGLTLYENMIAIPQRAELVRSLTLHLKTEPTPSPQEGN